MLTIDKNVPVPEENWRGEMAHYPLSGMAVGDSFFAQGKSSAAVGNAARRWCAQHDISRKFTCRTVTEDGVKGVRCWRVS